MKNIFKKGSEWRKWDLHVHTPESHGYTGDWKQFTIQLQQAACDVIGINDYFSVAGYKKIKSEIENGKLDIGDKNIFPVVEMRMTDSIQSRHNINSVSHFNFHIIFNPEVLIDDIENFIKSLMSEGTDIGTDYDNKEKLKNKKVSFVEVLKVLNENTKFKNNFLIWLPYSEYGGIDEINPESDAWIKDNFTKNSDILGSSNKSQIDFFLWNSPLKSDGSPKFTQQQFQKWLGHKKPCIKGSDSHKHSYPIGKLKDRDSNPIEKFCWIKTDPTFEGLKQILYDPENRVFIGEKPPIFSRIENNKTKYINRLTINKVDTNTGDTWFEDIEIPFNKELVAIIGNKGSGKSSIVDILGLVGDTHIDKKYFSFLNKDKFCKGQLADKFKAEIIWESGGKSGEITLSEGIKTENPESVRFIPQSYFEELTNELEILKFQITLENIIFGYIPNEEKLGKSSFSELEGYKTEIINKDIEIQKNEIKAINVEIIELERKKHPNYIRRINGLINEKNTQINEQNKLLQNLPNITNPTQNNENTEQKDTEVERKKAELSSLKSELKQLLNKRAEIIKKYENLKQIKERIEQQETAFKNFIASNKNEVSEYGLDINSILKIKSDYSSINKLIKSIKKESEAISPSLKSVDDIKQEGLQENNQSIYWKIKIVDDGLKKQIDALSKEQRAYQKNEQSKKDINEQISKLKGNAEHPENETLEFYKKEKDFVENRLEETLKSKRDKRLHLSINIFNKKEKILELYDLFKRKVDEQISNNTELLKNYDIKIDTSLNLKLSFYDDFLKHINQNKKGTFYGKEEGLLKIKKILKADISSQNDTKEALINIIDNLELDKRESEPLKRDISEQVTELDKFYEFLFSLDYLQPEYKLTLDKKALDELSPGERGALLLIFYLMIDKEDIPLIIDQPEDNLDNESVYNMLSKFIRKAKANRQIIMVTHNPNLAVGADAEQIIHVSIDIQKENKFSFTSGSIENIDMNKKIVKILEGTKPAFDKRKLKYQENN